MPLGTPLRLLLALLSCFCLQGRLAFAAQIYPYLHLSTSDGLPSSETYQIFQDQAGFIWILTDNGLARFDGYEVQTFTTQDGLPHNAVFRMLGDEQGKLWFLTRRNKLCYFSDGRFHPFAEQVPLDSLINFQVPTEISFDSRGRLWVWNPKGPSFAINPMGELVQEIENPYVNLHFFEDEGSARGRGSVLPKMEARYGKRPPTSVQISLPLVDTLFAIPDLGLGYPWYCGDGTEVFAFAYTDEVHLFRSDSPPLTLAMGGRVNHLDIWGSRIWVSTVNGLYHFDLGDSSPQLDTVQLPAQNFSGVFRDREDGYWVSTLDQGVFYFRSVEFQRLELSANRPSEGAWLVNGLERTILAAGQSQSLFLLEENQVQKHMSLDSGYQDRTRAILPWPDKQGFLICVPSAPIHFLQLPEASLGEFLPGQHTWANDVSLGLNGVLWAVRDGLYRIENGQVVPEFLGPRKGQHVVQDAAGKVWATIDRELVEFRHGELIPVSNLIPGLPATVNGLAVAEHNILLLASREDGLVGIKGDRAFAFPSLFPWTGRSINQVVVQANGDIWLATKQGIVFLQRLGWQWQVRNFTARDGLLTDEVHQLYVYGQEVWAATSEGLVYFDWSQIPKGDDSPLLHLVDFRVNGVEIPLGQEEPYRLKASQNTLDLEFTGLSYRQWGKVQYRYRLEGLEKEAKVTASKMVQYHQLPPGDYRLLVECSRVDGSWSPPQSVAAFSIAPPWWDRTWVALGFAILILALLLLIFRWREKIVRREEQGRTRIIALEKQALQAQMNPHFLFNSLNAIQSYLAEQDTEKAEIYLADFSRLIRLILENSRRSEVTLAKELELMQKYMAFESLRFDGRIRFEVELAPAIDTDQVFIPPMLLQPFVENAVVHGLARVDRPGWVRLSIHLREGHLACSIEDNGIGRKKAARFQHHPNRSGVGMMVTRERLALLNEKLPIDLAMHVVDLYDGEEAIGTRIELLIPFQLETQT